MYCCGERPLIFESCHRNDTCNPKPEGKAQLASCLRLSEHTLAGCEYDQFNHLYEVRTFVTIHLHQPLDAPVNWRRAVLCCIISLIATLHPTSPSAHLHFHNPDFSFPISTLVSNPPPSSLGEGDKDHKINPHAHGPPCSFAKGIS